MKLNPQQTLIQQQIFEAEREYYSNLRKPNPPTEYQVKKAQFKDKTYVWKHAGL